MRKNAAQIQEHKTTKLNLLQEIKKILSQECSNKDQKQQELLKILSNDLDHFLGNSIYKTELNILELKIDIVKLIKPLLLESESIFDSPNTKDQEKLTKFVHLISKSTAKQNKFQTDLANYIKLNFINIGDCVLIEKEGMVFQKNEDGTYSKKPAGTADVVIKIINKEGEVISQYCVECDGNSHTDKEKDDLRNRHLEKHSTLLCLKHGNIDFADYLLKTENSQYKEELHKILKAIRENRWVRNAQEERRLLLEQEKKKFSKELQEFKNSFVSLRSNDDNAELTGSKLGPELIGLRASQEVKEFRLDTPSKTDNFEQSLKEFQQIAQRELDLIEAFHKNIDEEKWDDLLNQVLEICKKPKEDQIDKYLLTIAKPYVATLLQINYQHEYF